MRFALAGFKLSFNTSYNVEAPGLTLYNWGGSGKGGSLWHEVSSVLDVHVLFCFQVDRLILYLGERGVGGRGVGLIHVSGNLLFMYGSLQV